MHDINVRNSYAGTEASTGPETLPEMLAGSPRQDRELLLLDSDCIADLRGRVAHLAELSNRLTLADLGGLGAALQRGLANRRMRAAVVAASPEQAATRFADLLMMLDRGTRAQIDVTGGVFLGEGAAQPRIGFLFPGQGSGKPDGDSALAQRFEVVRELQRAVTLPAADDHTATVVAQPRIALGSAAGLRVMSLLGIEASEAAGHSLGELVALHWAGAMTESELFALATARGRVMADASEGGGAMAGVSAGPDLVEPLLSGEPVVIACYNGPAQTVISGPAEAVERVRTAAAGLGLRTARVAVSHAFHSPLVEPAAVGLDEYLSGRRFQPLARRVVSTLTGEPLPAGTDLRQLLVRQLREPVRFSQALSRMAESADLFIEVGPGRVLTGLAAKTAPQTPVIPLSTDGSSLAGAVNALAAAFALGMPVRHDRLFADRFAAAGA
jgi:enediyne polyketide synthase